MAALSVAQLGEVDPGVGGTPGATARAVEPARPLGRNAEMVVVLIRTKLRADADIGAYEALSARMEQILAGIAGFIGAMGYTSADGEEIGIVRFESLAALRAWRDHPEHQQTQARGRTEFYAAYRIEVCEVVRAYEFSTESGRSPALD